jgi:hypothetical protein
MENDVAEEDSTETIEIKNYNDYILKDYGDFLEKDYVYKVLKESDKKKKSVCDACYKEYDLSTDHLLSEQLCYKCSEALFNELSASEDVNTVQNEEVKQYINAYATSSSTKIALLKCLLILTIDQNVKLQKKAENLTHTISILINNSLIEKYKNISITEINA